MADGTQRRRARDRNPQGLGRRMEQRTSIVPPTIRPLTMNPLRPSGPVRRTCGVIKLPVMLLSPPVGDTTLRDNILGTQGVNDQKTTHSLNVVVQSFWEKRLKTVKPLDYLSGKELSRQELQQQQQQQARQDNDVISLTTPLQQTSAPPTASPIAPPIPSLLSSQQLPGLRIPHSSATLHTSINSHRIPSSTINNNNTPLTGTKLLQVHQLKTLNNSSSSHMVPQCVTDNDVILQEQRVQLLRQQLMAAQSGL